MDYIELFATTDKNGKLKINYDLEIPNKEFRVLIVVEDDTENEEEILDSLDDKDEFDEDENDDYSYDDDNYNDGYNSDYDNYGEDDDDYRNR